MSKKIIALALALLMIVTVFTACSKKGKTFLINNKEYLLVTEKGGETLVDEFNRNYAIVTDAEGEIQTDIDGEDQTYVVEFKNEVFGEDFIQGPEFKLMAEKGWIPNRLGYLKLDKNEKCKIAITKVVDYEAIKDQKGDNKVTNMAMYLDKIDNQNSELIAAMEKEGVNLTIKTGTETITHKKGTIICQKREYMGVDANGKVMHYVLAYYFETADFVYKVSYECPEGAGYDKDFSLLNYLNNNFTFMGETK